MIRSSLSPPPHNALNRRLTRKHSGKDSNLRFDGRNEQQSVDAFLAEKAGDGSGDEGGGDGGRRVIIDDLYVRNGRADIRSPLLSVDGITVDLPTIHIEDVGRASGGVTPEEAAAIIVAGLNRRIGAVVGGLGLDEISNAANRLQRGARRDIEAVRETMPADLGSDTEEAVQDARDRIKEEVGDIFGE